MEFYHHKTRYSLMTYATIPFNQIESIPFLVTQEFAINPSTDIKYDKDQSYENTSQNELINLVVSRIKQFSEPKTKKEYKTTFISNLLFYIDKIGIENTSNYIMPFLSKLVDEEEDIVIAFLKNNIKIISYLDQQGGPLSYKLIKNNLFDIVNEIQEHRNLVLGQDLTGHDIVFDNYIKICKILNQEDLRNIILPKIIGTILIKHIFPIRFIF